MERMRLRAWVSVLTAAVSLSATVAVAQPGLPRENHYKLYMTPPLTYADPLLLTDQLGGYFVPSLVLEHWGNPATKILENGDQFPPVDPVVHQMWWRGSFPSIPPQEIVGIDQFGTNRWTLINPEYLVTPALKNVANGQPPVWNHYLCYATLPVTLGRVVTLVDQFGTAQAQLIYGFRFCNPVEKLHLEDGRLYPIIDYKAHLACYQFFNPDPMAHPIVAIDQFGNWQFDVFDNFCLCVPALKEHPVRTEESTWGRIKSLYQ